MKETDVKMFDRASDPLTDTQKKQLAFLDKMNSLERISTRIKYHLTCRDCQTRDTFTVAALCAQFLERGHQGHRTWVDKNPF